MNLLTSSDIGGRVRLVRADRSQEEFGQEIGFSQSQLSDLERGKTKNPPMELLSAVIRVTGCDGTWLLTGRGEPFPAGPSREGAASRHAQARRREIKRPIVSEISRDPAEAEKDPALYREWVPLLGYFAASGLIEEPSDATEDLGAYITWGPGPKGAIAVRLLTELAGFDADRYLIFGPPEKSSPHAGFALLKVKGRPEYMITGFEREQGRYVIYNPDYKATSVPLSSVLEVRLLFDVA